MLSNVLRLVITLVTLILTPCWAANVGGKPDPVAPTPTVPIGSIGPAAPWQPPVGFLETETCAVWKRSFEFSNTNGQEKPLAWTAKQQETTKTAILLAAWYCRKIPAFITNASGDGPIKLIRGHLSDSTAVAEAKHGCMHVDTEFFRRNEYEQARTLLHELTHLVDRGRLISEQPLWYDLVGRRILAFRKRVHWPIDMNHAREDLLTYECGLPSCYAAQDLTEALAEFNVCHIISGSEQSIEVLDAQTNRVFVHGKDVDPDTARYLERNVWQPLPAAFKQARNEILMLPLHDKYVSRSSLDRAANAGITHCTNAVRLVGATPGLEMFLAAAWLDKRDDEMALSSLNSAVRAMKRLNYLNAPLDVSLCRRWQRECLRRLRRRERDGV